ncbi:hypothetical protein BD310DRAFT_932856 [Dichomitus squalens]|uniref:Uncharacterized protein n=1 Tax=Dichomitus squalens TaxID=114155 RepID=A0A4Q9PNH2_9APHY|nr:hypothetical protein BD310DRAFT_932856 [Dichomitus squalens]
MIHTVNAMHPTPIRTSRSERRSRVASSSSTATYDTPRTPTDAYSHRSGSSLGQEFSVIKMGKPRSSANGHDPFDPEAFSGMQSDGGRPVPAWLRGTISTLETRNPLRLLLPDDTDAHEQSSHLSSEAFSDIIPMDEAPFAFTSPTHPPTHYIVPTNVTARSSPNTILIPTPVSTALEAGMQERVVKGHGTDFGDSIHHIGSAAVPFSTPGPASKLSLPASPIRARSHIDMMPYSSPDPVRSHTVLKAGVASPFKPFSRPGPIASTDSKARGVVTTFHLPSIDESLYAQHLVYSYDQDTTTPMPQPLLPPAYILPFSTPGPAASSLDRLCTATRSEGLRYTPTDPGPDLSLPDRSPRREPTPDQFYSRTASTKSRTKQSSLSPWSSSSSVERFLLTLHSKDDTPVIAQLSEFPFIADNVHEVARTHIDIDALDFKWERFDRGDIVADVTSASSPRSVHPGSEEAFWSQPAGHIPTPVASPTRLPVPRTDSSPASLRLTGISTPVAASPHKQAVLKHLGDQEKDGGLFAWIVPPRDAPPPSTPKASKTSSHHPATGRPPRHNADQDFPPAPASRPGPGVATAGGSPGGKHQRGVADRDETESTETGLSPPRRLPFAPGPGIYISPLRDNPDDGDETGGEDSGATRPSDRKVTRETCIDLV